MRRPGLLGAGRVGARPGIASGPLSRLGARVDRLAGWRDRVLRLFVNGVTVAAVCAGAFGRIQAVGGPEDSDPLPLLVQTIDDLGREISGAEIIFEVEGWDQTRAVRRTSPDGFAALPRPPTTAVVVIYAQAAGHLPQRLSGSNIEESPVVIRLRRAARVIGRLYPAPGEAVRLTMVCVYPERRDVPETWDDLGLLGAPRVESRPDGYFELPAVPVDRAYQLLSESTTIEVKHAILPLGVGEIRKDLRVKWQRGRAVVTRVVGTDGAPIAGAFVAVDGRRMSLRVATLSPDGRRLHADEVQPLVTDAAGRVHVRVLGREGFGVTVYAKGHRLAVASFEGPALGVEATQVVLERSTRSIAGLVRLPDGEPAIRVRVGCAAKGISEPTVTTDKSGRFVFEQVSGDGPWSVWAWGPQGERSDSIEVPSEGAPVVLTLQDHWIVQIPVRAPLDLTGVPVVIKVFRETQGSELKWVEVYNWSTEVDRDGMIRPRIPMGRLRLEVSVRGYEVAVVGPLVASPPSGRRRLDPLLLVPIR